MLLTNDNVTSENVYDKAKEQSLALMGNQQGLVKCAVCGFEGISLQSHIRKHQLTGAEYKRLYKASLVGEIHSAATKRSIQTRRERYGSSIPPTTRKLARKRIQDLIAEGKFSGQLDSVKAKMKLFGRDKVNAMHVPESARKNHLHRHNEPNWYEKWILQQAPQLQFVGNFKLKIQHPTLQKCKYPDFVRPGTNLLVEMFSVFWHSKRFKGVDAKEHEQEVINFYAACGYQCLIIWSSQIKKASTETIDRLTNFLRDYQEQTAPAVMV